MKPECRDLEVLRSLGAAGALDGDEAARLVVHLEACPDCRAAEEEERELLGLARLPPAGAAEARALADLPERALAELRAHVRRRRGLARVAAGAGVAAAAAAAVLLLLAPAIRDPGRSPQGGPQIAQTQRQTQADARWQEPDPDTLWTESAVLELADASGTNDTYGDAALAAYDAGAGDF